MLSMFCFKCFSMKEVDLRVMVESFWGKDARFCKGWRDRKKSFRLISRIVDVREQVVVVSPFIISKKKYQYYHGV